MFDMKAVFLNVMMSEAQRQKIANESGPRYTERQEVQGHRREMRQAHERRVQDALETEENFDDMFPCQEHDKRRTYSALVEQGVGTEDREPTWREHEEEQAQNNRLKQFIKAHRANKEKRAKLLQDLRQAAPQEQCNNNKQ